MKLTKGNISVMELSSSIKRLKRISERTSERTCERTSERTSALQLLITTTCNVYIYIPSLQHSNIIQFKTEIIGIK